MPVNVVLKPLRLRIDPSATMLGSSERSLLRQGRPVTQEELAEYLGVSRTWYAALESSMEVRPSFALLERLADVLMLTPEERTALFDAAFPELELADLQNRHLAANALWPSGRVLREPPNFMSACNCATTR